MLLPKFDFHRPDSIAETCAILDEYGDSAKLIAGGTDVLVNLKRRNIAPAHLIGIDRVADMLEVRTVKLELQLGSLVTATRLSENRTLKRSYPFLARAAGGLGSPPVRNRATIGGNIVTARPAADLLPPLCVLDATLSLTSSEETRELPITSFVVRPGQTRIRGNEVLTHVTLPKREPGSGGAYIKFGARHSCEISIVSVAAFVSLTPKGRRIKEAKIALGAVAPKVIRCPRAEELLKGANPDERAFNAAGQAAARASRPISDHRGSASYRRQMVEVLTRRALAAACAAARQDLAGSI